MNIYAIICGSSPTVVLTKYYSTLEKARKALKKVAEDRRCKLGVDVVIDEPDKFSYLLGWEEAQVTFSIVELPLE